MAKTETQAVERMTFEEAYAELEKIVAMMEAGEGTLEASLESFQRGQALVKRCSELLDGAELQVKELSGDLLMETDEGE